MATDFDVIVVGAGHAGCEAALASARLGVSTLLLTLNQNGIAMMPCNPSIGGPGKGHLVREIDALGGEMGRNADRTYLQMKLLNTSKGPAVQALRAQSDRLEYQAGMQAVLANTPQLTVRYGAVNELLVHGDRVRGVRLVSGDDITAHAVVITTGTYMKARVHRGEVNEESGPRGEPTLHGLSQQLNRLGFKLVRFKTGTPPRVHRDSIDFSVMSEQPGDRVTTGFSFLGEMPQREPVSCYLTHTNARTHAVIEENLHRAAMFTGAITGPGPRYCPSIEAKLVWFPGRERHQVFIEPETRTGEEMYVAGLSTSLPDSVQEAMVRSVRGLERAEILRFGYAIEYDCLDPLQLWPTLETKRMRGLFTAGQINGSTGYEEAAAQGIIAGINAALQVKGAPPLVLDRAEAYIGVLIDDLVTKGTSDPYRIMTSRAEYRLLLRHDNADVRLTPKGRAVGLVDDVRWERYLAKQDAVSAEMERLGKVRVFPSPAVHDALAQHGAGDVHQPTSLLDLLRRPQLSYEALAGFDTERPVLGKDVTESVEIRVKYAGYIEKQEEQVARFRRIESRVLPEGIDYSTVQGLSREAVEKLNRVQPRSVGQAARVAGVSPADVGVLLVYLESRRRGRIHGPKGSETLAPTMPTVAP